MTDEHAEFRAALATALLSGASAAARESAAEAARQDADWVAAVVDELAARGSWSPDGELAVSLSDLSELPAGPPLTLALAHRRAGATVAAERVRLARLYELSGAPERAAPCFRAVLDAVGLPLAAAVEVADAAAAGGRRALALAAVDRVAMGLTTGRRITQPDRADDPAKRDPEQMADLLVRAGRAARAAGSPPRAAALCRTAAEMLERAGDLRGARRAFAIAAAALRADDQPDLAASLAGRMRKLAQGDGDAQDEAIAMTIVAEVMADRGDLPKAIHLHKEAAKLLHQAGDRGGALDHTAALALLYERKGDVDGARKTLAAAADQAAKAELTPLARRLRQAEAELCLRAGQVGVAIEAAEQLHASFEPGDDPRGRARAGACLARILTVVGAGERAAEVLAGGDPHLASPEDVALALRARAGVARAAGHPTEATGLLTNAAALLGKGSPLFGELLLEAAELTAEDEATHPATRAALRRLEQAGALPPGLDLRVELLRARLCEDPDERELLVDDGYQRALTEGRLLDRALAAALKGRVHLDQGDPDAARDAIQPVIEQLVRARKELPEELRGGVRRSPLFGPVLAVAAEIGG